MKIAEFLLITGIYHNACVSTMMIPIIYFVLTKHADPANMSHTYQLSFYNINYALQSVISVQMIIVHQYAY